MLTRLATLTAVAAAATLPAFAQAAPSAAGPSIMSQVLLFLPLILIFYFLLIRPQQKRQREQDQMLKALEKGDLVVTAGGLHGTVVGITDDTLTVEIAALKGERVRVKVSRSKVESRTKRGEDS